MSSRGERGRRTGDEADEAKRIGASQLILGVRRTQRVRPVNSGRPHRLAILLAGTLLSSGCSVLEWLGGLTHERLEGAKLKPYLNAAEQSNREALGFTPLPKSGPVSLELPRSRKHYDAMLHIERGPVSRTVDFVVKDGRLVWSGEQEIHFSGRQFETADGPVTEQLVISYSTVAGSGTPKGGYVDYWGPDLELQERANRHRLSVAEAKAIWDGWPQKVKE